MKINALPKTFPLLHKTEINGRTFAVIGDENEQCAFSINDIREMFYGDASLDTLVQGEGFFLRLPDVGDLIMISKHGVPSGWAAGGYWSATPSGSGHAVVALHTGVVFDRRDFVTHYVAFEVIQ